MRSLTDKPAALSFFFAILLLTANISYGLGGGGGHGDGRLDIARPTSGAGFQQPSSSLGNTGGSGAQPGSTGGSVSYGPFFGSVEDTMVRPTAEPVVLPEPIAAFLIGAGIAAIAGARRAFKK